MKQPKQWRIEVFNSRKSSEWRTLWEIDDDELIAAQELKNELNRINFPVVVRVVPTST